jgi:hypothetical protein
VTGPRCPTPTTTRRWTGSRAPSSVNHVRRLQRRALAKLARTAQVPGADCGVHGHGALADCRGDQPDRTLPHVTGREHAGPAGLQRQRRATVGPRASPLALRNVSPGEDEGSVVERELVASRRAWGLHANEHEHRARVQRALFPESHRARSLRCYQGSQQGRNAPRGPVTAGPAERVCAPTCRRLAPPSATRRRAAGRGGVARWRAPPAPGSRRAWSMRPSRSTPRRRSPSSRRSRGRPHPR